MRGVSRTEKYTFVTKCLPTIRSAMGALGRLCVDGLRSAQRRGPTRAGDAYDASSEGQRQIRREVGSAVSRQIPDTPILRCVGCGGTRLIPLTFAGSRRTRRSEVVDRASAKCVTCGCRYVGVHVLPAERTLVSLAAVNDANRLAPWGPALAEWRLLLDTERRDSSAQTPASAHRRPATRSRFQLVLET